LDEKISFFSIERVQKATNRRQTVKTVESRKQNLQMRNYINSSDPHSFLLLSKNPLIHFLLQVIESTKAFYSINQSIKQTKKPKISKQTSN
jgi:hypothetical protein